jgi:hypothetical protein
VVVVIEAGVRQLRGLRGVSMPSVMQVSMPIWRTPLIISMIAGMSRSLGLRQAAPMQKRCDPASLACAADCSTACTSISLVAFTPLSAEADCEQ